jgi:ADP-ribose pyrophosphatase YjhB (NUDIX family)
MSYQMSKRIISIGFNLLNILLGGHLPPFGCACVIVEQEGRYLVLERPDGSLAFPGGFSRWHEHPVQTAMREGHEETGLFLEVGDVITVYPGITQRLDDMSTITIIYQAKVVGGSLRPTAEGQPCWFDEQTIREKSNHYYAGMLDDYHAWQALHRQISPAHR